MNDKRSLIVAELEARLKAISLVNGYRTEAGAVVLPWMKYRSRDEEDPIVLTYRDPSRQAGNVGGEDRSLGEENFLLDIELQAITADDDEELSIAHDIIRDLRRAVGLDPTFGGIAERTTWISDEIDTEVGGTITSFVNVTMQVFYVALDWAE